MNKEKKCPDCKIIKSTSEFCSDKRRRWWIWHVCRPCKNIRAIKWQLKNPDKLKKSQQNWREENKEKRLKDHAEYRRVNRKDCNERFTKWRINNPDKHSARQWKRRATKLDQTPTHSIKEAIDIYYFVAHRLWEVLLKKFHVDHIYPLSKGWLHSQENLQVMEWKDNLAKWAKILTNITTTTNGQLNNRI
jgi:phage FluMu protein Com